MWLSMLHLCDEVARHWVSLEDVDVTPLPKGFIMEAPRIIKVDRSVQGPCTIPENGWDGEVNCLEPGESPPATASSPQSPPPSTPLLFDEEDPLWEPEGNIAGQRLENLLPAACYAPCYLCHFRQ